MEKLEEQIITYGENIDLLRQYTADHDNLTTIADKRMLYYDITSLIKKQNSILSKIESQEELLAKYPDMKIKLSKFKQKYKEEETKLKDGLNEEEMYEYNYVQKVNDANINELKDIIQFDKLNITQ